MDLSIIIVSWNVRDLLKENLKAIYGSENRIGLEVFVVDNNSSDGSAEMVKNEFKEVKLIANKENAGFARANNQVLKEAKGRYILLLNPDMRVLPGTIEGMVGWMDAHPEAGVAGCRLVKENGGIVPHVRRFPAVWDQLAIILKLPHLFPAVLNKYLLKEFDYSKEAEVDSIRGSFFMIRREVIDKLGGLDERYFVWFEEVDYCRQAKRAGWKVMYAPEVKCVDYIGKSFLQVRRGKAQEYFRDSMLKYFKKWHPAWQYWILKMAWPIGIFLARIGELVNSRGRART